MINVATDRKKNILYHAGRLVGYIGLGAIAGLLGSSFFNSSILHSFQIMASLFIGIFFCWMAYRIWKKESIHFSIVPMAVLNRLQNWSLRQKLVSPALMIGLISALLPCGWLHTFVLAALALHSPLQGSLLLFSFWLGTVPLLVMSQVTIKRFHAPLAQYSSKFLAILFLILGVSDLGLKCYPLVFSSGDTMEDCPMHGHHH